MNRYISLLTIACFFIISSSVGQNVWKKVERTQSFKPSELAFIDKKPSNFELYAVNLTEIDATLVNAVSRKIRSTKNVIIKLPTPNGIQRFLVKEASVFSADLAAKYPTIKSYVGTGLDDPSARVRFSKSIAGFHAMISSGNYPMYLISPYTKDKKTGIAYLKKDVEKSDFDCLVIENKKKLQGKSTNLTNANDGKLRTYRLALIATGEYSQFHLTGSSATTDAEKKAVVLAAMNTTMTRVNGIFERDLGVTMEIVTNNEDLIFLNAATDNLTNNDGEALIDESQMVCDTNIGNGFYDIGHAFSTGGGGLAGLGVVCLNGQKGKGITGRAAPVGDTFDIDYVAHELGHQFGGNHTQNTDCQRNDATAVEPGSASTIMGYAGICDPNVQSNSDAYFHAVSIAEIWSVVSATTCAVESETNNNAPVVNAGNDFVIPKSTAFVLKGSATDVDTGNSLTYNWEQIDAEITTMPPSLNSTNGPSFRSLPSSTSPNRFMPALATVLSGFTSSTWEVVSSKSRTYNFSLTVRDNVANGGATARDDVIISVDGNSGPFKVTSQSSANTLNGDSTQTITWNVANTNAGFVNCDNVKISLSTDGGLTYPNVLSATTPNDGTEDITLTNISTTKARIKVEAIDNIFYAVNTRNFSIDKTVSVNDVSFANFAMYPNPSKGKVQLKFDVLSTNKVTVQLIDLRGRLIVKKVYENTANIFSEELDFEKIRSGLYFLQIRNGIKQITRKLILN